MSTGSRSLHGQQNALQDRCVASHTPSQPEGGALVVFSRRKGSPQSRFVHPILPEVAVNQGSMAKVPQVTWRLIPDHCSLLDKSLARRVNVGEYTRGSTVHLLACTHQGFRQ